MTGVPALAAITLDPRGGGIASVARVLARVFADEWGDRCRVVTLVPTGAGSLESTTTARVVFGGRLAWAQAHRSCSLMLYSHLAIARAQAFVPAPIRRPHAVFLHGIEVWRPLPRAQQRILRDASVLLVNSAYTARRIREVHPWMPAPLVCPLTLETPVAADVPVQSDRRWGPHAVLLVGRMATTERYKGHDELLDAWPRVVAAVPDARLVFVGEGDDRDRLRERAQAMGVSASLIMTGFLDRVGLDDAYDNAAVFAMPSRNEGFGLVYLEAMARGLPCVGSLFDAAAEVIDDGVTGFLVDQTNRTALGDRLIALLQDRAMREAMGARGRERASDRFGYSQFRERVVSAIARGVDRPLQASAFAGRIE